MSQTLEELRELQKEKISKLNVTKDKLRKLEKNAKVKTYIEENAMQAKLKTEVTQLELNIRTEEMISCSHISIISEIDIEYDGHRTDRIEERVCIKCGLDTKSKERVQQGYVATELDYAMRTILNKHGMKGITTDIKCNYALAKAIYDRILQIRPGLKDEQVVRFMNTVLSDIRENPMTSEVEESWVKRLKLNPKFKSWHVNDIIRNN